MLRSTAFRDWQGAESRRVWRLLECILSELEAVLPHCLCDKVREDGEIIKRHEHARSALYSTSAFIRVRWGRIAMTKRRSRR